MVNAKKSLCIVAEGMAGGGGAVAGTKAVVGGVFPAMEKRAWST
jgi:hypothetical protein